MTEEALNRLLADWAARHALPTERAVAIRDAVLAAPQITVHRLPPGWWGGFMADLKTTLRQSTYMPPTTWYSGAMFSPKRRRGESGMAQARSVST